MRISDHIHIIFSILIQSFFIKIIFWEIGSHTDLHCMDTKPFLQIYFIFHQTFIFRWTAPFKHNNNSNTYTNEVFRLSTVWSLLSSLPKSYTSCFRYKSIILWHWHKSLLFPLRIPDRTNPKLVTLTSRLTIIWHSWTNQPCITSG